MPVSELVCPGPPVTSESAGLRWMRAQASAAWVDARFVPHVDDADARARRRREHFVQMIAHQGEDRVDPQLYGIACTNSSAPFGIEPPCYYNVG